MNLERLVSRQELRYALAHVEFSGLSHQDKHPLAPAFDHPRALWISAQLGGHQQKACQ